MKLLPIHLLLCVLILASGAAGAEPARQCQPVISGVLWWLNPAAERPKLNAILDAMQQAGMDTLWLLNTTQLAADPNDTFLENIYSEADRRKWRIIIETSCVSDWWHRWDLPALKEADRRHVENVTRRYSRHPSFYGWYIGYEVYMEWGDRSDKIRDLYNHVGELTRKATPGAKLTLSPFFLADQRQIRGNFRYATPEEYGKWWQETIRQAGIDIVMLQDSGAEHCECVDNPTRAAFFSAMERACKGSKAELWGNAEMVEYRAKTWDEYARKLAEYKAAKADYPWSFDMSRNAAKLDLASRYSTKIVSWGWEFWNPVFPQDKVGNSRDNYAAYLRYCQDASRPGGGLREAGPLADAVAVWPMADLKDSAGRNSGLVAQGNVNVRVELTGADRAASVARGGDGRVAVLNGGYLDAGQGADGELNLSGRAFTLCARLRDPSGNWMAPLFSKHGGHDKLVYNLFSHDFGQGKLIGFELGTDRTAGMTQVTVPLQMIGATEWHDIICRFDGAKLQMFIDGVWLDEGFPMGSLRQGNREPCLIGGESVNGSVKSGWRGMVDHVAVWSRAITDAEIETLSGGAEEVSARRKRYLGDSPSMQYFRPHNQFNVGDTLPFFHDGTFHFYYLLDRGHHSAKGGQGAHQWAHASSQDLVHWTQHPLAVPITRGEEGSICTGSVFFHAGVYYAFYATRIIGKGEHLSLATSADGVHFAKTDPNPFLSPAAKYTGGFRDPHVFLEQRTGLFHLLVSTMLKEGRRGCLAHYTSTDLKRWTEGEPFLVEGGEVPECPDYFEWNGRYYLLYSNGQVAHYRMSRQPLGPWDRPKSDVIDGAAARVMKTAGFTGNRRIGTASIWPHGYAGWAVFRELVQREDGTLGSKFVPEMIPPAGNPVQLALKPLGDGVSGDGRQVRIRAAEGITQAMLSGASKNARIRLRMGGNAAKFGLRLRASADGGQGHELCFAPAERRVWVTGGPALGEVDSLDHPFNVDIILRDNIVDLCVNEQRTLVSWARDAAGDRLVLFVENGEATFSEIIANPLR